MENVMELFYRGDGTKRGNTVYFYDIIVDGKTVGECELRDGETEQCGNVGYRIDIEHRGRGYAADALVLLKTEAEERGIEKLIICCDSDNVASQNTAKRAGAELIGEEDIPEDSELYAYGKRKIIKYLL